MRRATVGGECEFHHSYDGESIWSMRCASDAKADLVFIRLLVRQPVIYIGAKIGRDGIHGATMASAEFGSMLWGKATDSASRRPIYGEIADRSLPRADVKATRRRDPDMGAARRPSAVEMASKGGLGIELDLDCTRCARAARAPTRSC